ncbi:MAG: hypothetical protein KTR31_21180 [Myxococcales bacterium]|nr:hypothetical protein [Myxococcales bacterium]
MRGLSTGIVAFVVAVWPLRAAVAAPCDGAVTAHEIRGQASTVQEFLVEDQGAVLRARPAMEVLLGSVACAGETLSRDDAAAVLMTVGLTEYYAGNTDAARRAFGVVRGVVPTIELPTLLAPYATHPLAVLWGDAEVSGRTVRLAAPDDGLIFVNGNPAMQAPADGPFVLQEVGPDGRVLRSAWMSKAEAIPKDDPRPRTGRSPTRFVLPLTVLGAGATMTTIGAANAVGTFGNREMLCNEPDVNGDGKQDCPASVNARYVTEISVASVGAVLAVVGSGLLVRQATLSPMAGDRWGAVVHIDF